MSMTDPIGDMLTRIRNAARAGHEKVVIPGSIIKENIAKVLKDEGFVQDVVVRREEKKSGDIVIVLKYDAHRISAISDIRRISRPGLRKYVASADIPHVLNGMGIAILSTSKGVLVDRDCRKENVGGELLCTVY